MATTLNSANITFADSSQQTTATKLFGVSQTYAAPSRAFATTYTNSGSKPIFVSVIGFTTAGAGDSFMSLFVNGARIQYSGHSPDAASIFRITVSGIVPVGSTYSVTVTNITLESWREMS